MTTSLSAELMQLLAQYHWCGQPRIIPGMSGMNNTTITLEDDCERAIIRIYNNHADLSKLEFEHRMLLELQRQSLSLALPVPQMNRMSSTISTLEDGRLAARFCYIEGERPSTSSKEQMTSLAAAAAELSVALSKLTVAEVPAYSPYYELADNYAPFNEEAVLRQLAHAELAQLEDELLLIQRERSKLEQLQPELMALPQQWIHGDINCSNSLAVGDRVTAILDFEFVTRDMRVMELAVLLSELIKPQTEALLEKLEAMQEAFVAIVPLHQSEIDLLPELIKLRSVDVAMHFVQRFEQGLDQGNVLASIIEHAAFAINYVNKAMA